MKHFLFYSVNGTVYECQRCKTKKYNFQVNFFYIFPLEEVRQYRIRQNQEQYELYNLNLKIETPLILKAFSSRIFLFHSIYL